MIETPPSALCGRSKYATNKSKMASLKIEKSYYLRNQLTEFDKISHADASRPSGPHKSIKFLEFKNPEMAAAAILEIKNCNISAMD